MRKYVIQRILFKGHKVRQRKEMLKARYLNKYEVFKTS